MIIPDIDILRLTFRLKARDSIILPPFLGSTLRGAFGTALKKVFCFVPHHTCQKEKKNAAGKTEVFDKCWFYEACPFQYIFESPNLIPNQANHKLLRGAAKLPHPFVINAPALQKRSKSKRYPRIGGKINFNEDYEFNHFSKGERLEFSIVLIGRAAHSWAQVLVAVRLAAEIGLGKENSRVPFSLANAFAYDENGREIEIYNEETGSIAASGVRPLKLKQMIDLELETLAPKDEIEVSFPSPASQRILLDNAAPDGLKFGDLVKKISERLEFLAFLHAEPSQKIDYRPFFENAESVRVSGKNLKYYIYEQHSGANDEIKRRNVFVGKLIYQGEKLRQYLPLLKAGEIFNVGKDTSHGLGRIAVS